MDGGLTVGRSRDVGPERGTSPSLGQVRKAMSAMEASQTRLSATLEEAGVPKRTLEAFRNAPAAKAMAILDGMPAGSLLGDSRAMKEVASFFRAGDALRKAVSDARKQGVGAGLLKEEASVALGPDAAGRMSAYLEGADRPDAWKAPERKASGIGDLTALAVDRMGGKVDLYGQVLEGLTKELDAAREGFGKAKAACRDVGAEGRQARDRVAEEVSALLSIGKGRHGQVGAKTGLDAAVEIVRDAYREGDVADRPWFKMYDAQARGKAGGGVDDVLALMTKTDRVQIARLMLEHEEVAASLRDRDFASKAGLGYDMMGGRHRTLAFEDAAMLERFRGPLADALQAYSRVGDGPRDFRTLHALDEAETRQGRAETDLKEARSRADDVRAALTGHGLDSLRPVASPDVGREASALGRAPDVESRYRAYRERADLAELHEKALETIRSRSGDGVRRAVDGMLDRLAKDKSGLYELMGVAADRLGDARASRIDEAFRKASVPAGASMAISDAALKLADAKDGRQMDEAYRLAERGLRSAVDDRTVGGALRMAVEMERRRRVASAAMREIDFDGATAASLRARDASKQLNREVAAVPETLGKVRETVEGRNARVHSALEAVKAELEAQRRRSTFVGRLLNREEPRRVDASDAGYEGPGARLDQRVAGALRDSGVLVQDSPRHERIKALEEAVRRLESLRKENDASLAVVGKAERMHAKAMEVRKRVDSSDGDDRRAASREYASMVRRLSKGMERLGSDGLSRAIAERVAAYRERDEAFGRLPKGVEAFNKAAGVLGGERVDPGDLKAAIDAGRTVADLSRREGRLDGYGKAALEEARLRMSQAAERVAKAMAATRKAALDAAKRDVEAWRAFAETLRSMGSAELAAVSP